MSSGNVSHDGAPPPFPQFIKLPPEIRVMIWHHAAQIPRLIGVEQELEGNHMRCPLLLVNWEARVEALKYKKDLNYIVDVLYKDLTGHAPVILANLDIDIISLRSDETEEDNYDLREKMMMGRWWEVRRLAMDYRLYRALFRVDEHQFWNYKAEFLLDLNLDEIILLVPEVALANAESTMAQIAESTMAKITESVIAQIADEERIRMSDVKDEAQQEYDWAVKDGATREYLQQLELKDVSDWRVPKISVMRVREFESQYF